MPKPRSKKKRFIDPKRENTVTFDLVHRSQKDPLAADDEAPQRVLQIQKQTRIAEKKVDPKQKEEQREFGVFFDDEYDYLQHLKDRKLIEHDWGKAEDFLGKAKERKEKRKADDEKDQFEDAEESEEEEEEKEKVFTLPSVAFATRGTEEEVGLLNKAAPRSGPRLDWDPDIVETLDDDFKHEQVFTLKDEGDEEAGGDLDDFLAQAMEEGDFEEEEEGEEGDYDSDFGGGYGSEDEDGEFAFSDEETKTKFTQYSMSSSVMPRSEHLQTLDDRFEKFFDEYEDDNTGALDMEEIEGVKSEHSETMKQILAEHKKNRALDRQKPDFQKLIGRIPEEEEADDVDEDEKLKEQELVEIEQAKEKWDAESILSTYSNIYHHPKLISERGVSKRTGPGTISISGKTGMPKDVFGKGLTMSALKQLDAENSDGRRDYETATLTSRVSELSIRNKHETAEEKKERKNAFKEYKKERRMEKKANQMAFKEEQGRQEKNTLNNRRNVQGQKIV